MQLAASLHFMIQAIDMLEGVQPRLPDMTDQEWLACVNSLLLPLEHFRADFASTRLDVWQHYF